MFKRSAKQKVIQSDGTSIATSAQTVMGEVVVDVYRKFEVAEGDVKYEVSGPENELFIVRINNFFSGLRISRAVLEKIVEVLQTTSVTVKE